MFNIKKVVLAISVTAVLSTGIYVANEEYNSVALAIHTDDTTIGVKVKKGTVADILKQQGIVVHEGDRVEPSLDTYVKNNDTIKIHRAHDIVIKDGNNEETRKTTYKKVEDILKELDIQLSEYDKVSPELDNEVASVDTITITRVEKENETQMESIPYSTKEEADSSLNKGERKVKISGINGEKEVVKETVKENGEIVSENTISETVITEPTEEVVLVGTKETSSQGNYSGYISNGNTAGSDGEYAAQEMAARTGVSAETWKHIIARESNGQPSARNASGASGLFQTMPGWGSTATVEDQINAATRAYNAQGLRAWGM